MSITYLENGCIKMYIEKFSVLKNVPKAEKS